MKKRELKLLSVACACLLSKTSVNSDFRKTRNSYEEFWWAQPIDFEQKSHFLLEKVLICWMIGFKFFMASASRNPPRGIHLRGGGRDKRP